jgi:hypothetical protein
MHNAGLVGRGIWSDGVKAHLTGTDQKLHGPVKVLLKVSLRDEAEITKSHDGDSLDSWVELLAFENTVKERDDCSDVNGESISKPARKVLNETNRIAFALSVESFVDQCLLNDANELWRNV